MTARQPTTPFAALLYAFGADLTALAQAEDHLRAYSTQMDHLEQHAEEPDTLPTPDEMRQRVAREAQGYATSRARDEG